MLTLEEAQQIIGTKELSITKKMPFFSFGLPAQACITGAKLHEVPDSVCNKCYSWNRGNYSFPHVKDAQQRRLQNLSNPNWVEAMVILINHSTTIVRRKGKDLDPRFFRWHDAGDLQSMQHLANICKICEQLKKVRFWLPTREYGIVQAFIAQGGAIPKNLTIRLSAHMIGGPVPKALATKLGVQMSGVHLKDAPLPKGFTECGAHTRENQCGDCRACWDKRVKIVSYQKH